MIFLRIWHPPFRGDDKFLALAGKPIYGELRFLELLGGKIPWG
jgi:hypothetical protein